MRTYREWFLTRGWILGCPKATMSAPEKELFSILFSSEPSYQNKSCWECQRNARNQYPRKARRSRAQKSQKALTAMKSRTARKLGELGGQIARIGKLGKIRKLWSHNGQIKIRLYSCGCMSRPNHFKPRGHRGLNLGPFWGHLVDRILEKRISKVVKNFPSVGKMI